MATTGMLTDDPWRIYREDLAASTCEITMAASGGPLIDFDGNFVGMNFYHYKRTPFLPKDKILELPAEFDRIYTLRRAGRKKLVDSKFDVVRGKFKMPKILGDHKPDLEGEKIPKIAGDHKPDLEGSSRGKRKYMDQKDSICPLCDPEGQPGFEDDLLGYLLSTPRWPYVYGGAFVEARKKKLESCGYPFPLVEDRETRFFACTGVFIDCNESTTRVLTSASLVRTSGDENKIVESLKIKVCLPDKRLVPGMLQHYNLHYNIAVISIDFRCTQTAQIYDEVQIEPHTEVVAVGRVYESGKLMATGGQLVENQSELNCKELRFSTCKTTKAGIGGPLIDFDGNFIGMNFYGLKGTPYLPKNIILELLRNFDGKTVATDLSNNQNPNSRWPVLKPYWCYPKWHKIQDLTDVPPVELQ